MRIKSRRIILLSLLTFYVNGTFSQDNVLKIEAVYLYHILKYISWPEEQTGSNFTIGVIERPSITPFLEDLAKTRRVGERGIDIVSFASTDDFHSCNLLYLAEDQVKFLPQLTKKCKESGTLLILRNSDGSHQDVPVTLLQINGKLTFDIDIKAAAAVNLKFSGELIKLANKVYR